MGNFTASEILTIIVVILIVFGPNRLPELARKAGQMAATARRAMDSLKGELNAEYGDVIAPLRDARNELRSTGNEIRGQVADIGKEVSAAGNEIKDVTRQSLEPLTGAESATDVPSEATEPDAPSEPVEAGAPSEATEPDVPSEVDDGVDRTRSVDVYRGPPR